MSPGPVYRYGGLVVIVGLLGWSVALLAHIPPAYPYEHYANLIVGSMMLLNHLAFAFHWSRRITPWFRAAGLLGLISGCFYLFYLSRIWFPLPHR
jgi:hypothetical protein